VVSSAILELSDPLPPKPLFQDLTRGRAIGFPEMSGPEMSDTRNE